MIVKFHPLTLERRLQRIASIIEQVDVRCMAADGPVTPTLSEMTQAEISEIYGLAAGQDEYCPPQAAPTIATDKEEPTHG